QPGSTWLRFHWRDLEAVSRQTKSNLRAQLRIRTSKVIRPNEEDGPPEYDWLQPGEQVIVFSRRHWVAFLRKMLPAIVTFLILFVFLAVANLLPGPQEILRVIILFLLVIDGVAIAWGTVDYFNDWLVITNRRVVHQEKVLFVNEWRKEAPLEQIQNVNFESDWLGKILNYGTMTIATAATVGTISFDYTRHFSELRSTIMAQREQRRRHTVAESKTAINRMLEARLGMAISAPSRVYHGGPITPPLTGWRKRVSESLNTRLRK
ncbi:MAG: PH domain-containing protein, partial [Caldilinea sp.]|nr:PH domain-containing protein [Caldilinea sp.]